MIINVRLIHKTISLTTIGKPFGEYFEYLRKGRDKGRMLDNTFTIFDRILKDHTTVVDIIRSSLSETVSSTSSMAPAHCLYVCRGGEGKARGVWAVHPIESGVWFGPLEGDVVPAVDSGTSLPPATWEVGLTPTS